MRRLQWLGLSVLTASAIPVFSGNRETDGAVAPPQPANYWHQGKAEVSRFDLVQVRYGEERRGHMIQVFVTEDFLPDRQVKMESGRREERGGIPILKLNSIRRFRTGIYDYSMMRSVFSPMDVDRYPRALKATASIQEWCGHVWLQLNHRKDHFAMTGHSYFEREADEREKLPLVWLEDELWTRIRLGPHKLPSGDVEMIPSSFDTRLRHYRPRAEAARITSKSAGAGLRKLTVDYPRLGRTLTITFEVAAPHRIHSFEEGQRSERGVLRTRGVRTHQIMTAYWNQSGNRHEGLRKQLGL